MSVAQGEMFLSFLPSGENSWSHLPILGRVIDFINPDALGTEVQSSDEHHVKSWDGQGSRLQVLMVGHQRLSVRVVDTSNKVLWHSLSPVFRRIGPGPLMLGARWDARDFSISVNSRLIGSPNGPDSNEPIVFGDWNIEDQTFFYEKRSTKARNKRRLRGQQISQIQFKRLCELLVGEIQNLKLDLRDHRSGALSRILSVMGVLRKLVVPTEGNALLQRVAGCVDGPLDVFASSLEALFGPNISQIIKDGHLGEGLTMLSRLSPQLIPSARTRLDFDVWLEQKSWIYRRDMVSNELVIRSCGTKTGSHADADETPLMEEARKIWVSDHLGRDILSLWTLAVAEVVVGLAENQIFPLIPPQFGFQRALQACRNIR